MPLDITSQHFYEVWVKKCKGFGVLCKRASMLSSTTNRLRLLASAYTNVERVILAREVQNKWTNTLGKVGLAAATSTFILGWDEPEYHRVLAWVRSRKEGSVFVQGFRIFFWEFIDHEDTKASLLSYIINTLGETLKLPSTLVESRVAVGLYLLLGPAPASHDQTLTIFQ